MNGKDELNDLFKTRLSDAEMPVRDGFWDALSDDIAERPRRIALFPRLAAAASVLLILGVASAAFWYFSPQEEVGQAFERVAVVSGQGSFDGDRVSETLPSIYQTNPVIPDPMGPQASPAPTSSACLAGGAGQVALSAQSVQVHISITFSSHYSNFHGTPFMRRNGADVARLTRYDYYDYLQQRRAHQTQAQLWGEGADDSYESRQADEHAAPSTSKAYGASKKSKDSDSSEYSDGSNSFSESSESKTKRWSLKAAVGSALGKGNLHMPFTAQVTGEYALNRTFGVEAGLQYNLLGADGAKDAHSLAIPVRATARLAESNSRKVQLYATAGGTLEKIVAGSGDCSFEAEPVQLAVNAGLGVRYQVSDRLALYAEPSVSHHFNNNSDSRNLRHERATNVGLLCGVRMTY